MNYEEYFKKFAKNDNEEVIQYIPNFAAEAFRTQYPKAISAIS